MKYKQFCNWCNDRFQDGYWGMKEAMLCVKVLEDVREKPFWKREKYWKLNYEEYIYNRIIIPTNLLIKEYTENVTKIMDKK